MNDCTKRLQAPQYLPALDGMRGIAILMVLWLHLFQSGAPITNKWVSILASFSSIGQTGVDLFFVLSGFLITRILLFSKEHKRYFYNFYMRRVLRIFPLYYSFLFFYFIIFPLFSNFQQFSYNQFWFWIYLQNFALTFEIPIKGPNHFWSLAIEEHFYLVWPFMVYYLSEKSLYRAIGISFIICISFRALLMHYGWGTYYFTFCRIDGLALGAFLAIVEKNGRIKDFKKIFIWGSIASLFCGIIFYLILGGKANYWVQLIKPSAIALVFFCLIGLIILFQPNHWLNKMLQLPILRFTGKISYGLYVLQGTGVYLAIKLGLYNSSFLLSMLGMFLINFIIAYLSFRFFENPFLKLKTKYT